MVSSPSPVLLPVTYTVAPRSPSATAVPRPDAAARTGDDGDLAGERGGVGSVPVDPVIGRRRPDLEVESGEPPQQEAGEVAELVAVGQA